MNRLDICLKRAMPTVWRKRLSIYYGVELSGSLFERMVVNLSSKKEIGKKALAITDRFIRKLLKINDFGFEGYDTETRGFLFIVSKLRSTECRCIYQGKDV